MTEVPEVPGDELTPILSICAGLLTTAIAARNFTAPGIDGTPHTVHSALIDARARLDQLEQILSQAMDLKQASAMEATALEQAAQDAWDKVADDARKRGLRDQYEGAQEKYATWRLKTREQHLAARHARAVADIAATCEAKVRMYYRGLDGARMDLHKRLSALAFESSLERT